MFNERQAAEEAAPRFAEMTDADIRAWIARLVGNVGFSTNIGATAQERADAAQALTARIELLRRACVRFGLPFLTFVQVMGLRDAKRLGKITLKTPALILIGNELVEMGLLHDVTRDNSGAKTFRLSVLGSDLLEAADDVAVNLREAVKARRPVSLDDVALMVSRDVLSTAGAVPVDTPALVAAE